MYEDESKCSSDTASDATQAQGDDVSDADNEAKKRKQIWLNVAIAFGALFLIAVIVLASVFSQSIEWTAGQHIVGIFVGLILAATVVYFEWANSKIDALFLGEAALIGLSVVFIVNTILAFVLPQSYSIIFYWFSGFLLVGAIGDCVLYVVFFDYNIYSFYDEDVFRWSILIGVLIIGSFVSFLGMTMSFEWWQWQNVIGAFVGLILCIGVPFLVEMYIDKVLIFTDCLIGIIFFVGLILFILFTDVIAISIGWLCGFIVLSATLALVFYLSKNDLDLYSIVLIVEGAFAIILLIIDIVMT